MVNTKQNNFMLPMGIDLLSSQWSSDKGIVIKHPRKAFLNSYLTDMLVKGEELLMMEQRKQGSALSKIQIKDLMSSLFCDCQQQEGNVVGIFKKMINDKSKRKRTQEIYAVTLRKNEKYVGKHHLLRFCDRMKSYRNFMNKMNNCMKELIPGCTSYYARHSVASIAAELDVPLDTIARMLGHMDSTRRVTLIYVDFNQNKVDEANRRVIDYVLYNKR